MSALIMGLIKRTTYIVMGNISILLNLILKVENFTLREIKRTYSNKISE